MQARNVSEPCVGAFNFFRNELWYFEHEAGAAVRLCDRLEPEADHGGFDRPLLRGRDPDSPKGAFYLAVLCGRRSDRGTFFLSWPPARDLL